MKSSKTRQYGIESFFFKTDRGSSRKLCKQEPIDLGYSDKENARSGLMMQALKFKNHTRNDSCGGWNSRGEQKCNSFARSGKVNKKLSCSVIYHILSSSDEDEEPRQDRLSSSKKQCLEESLQRARRRVQPITIGSPKKVGSGTTDPTAARLRGMLSFSLSGGRIPKAVDSSAIPSGAASNPIVITDSSSDEELPDYSVTNRQWRRPSTLASECASPVENHLEQHSFTPTSVHTLPSSVDVQQHHQPVAITPLSKELQELAVLERQSPSCVEADKNTSHWLPGGTDRAPRKRIFNFDNDVEVVSRLEDKESVSTESVPSALTWSKADMECSLPYTNDLHLLVAANGRGLSNPTEGTVKLFSSRQEDMVEQLLSMTCTLLNQKLLNVCCYLRLITNSGIMPTSHILYRLWEVLTSNKDVSDKVADQVVQYMDFVALVHPPGRNKSIKTQYKELLLAMSRRDSLINQLVALFQGCEWKLKLLSCLVGLMVDDYYSTTSAEHPASSRSLTQDCLFRHLFWKADKGGMVTRPVRQLVDLTVDAYTNWTGTWNELEGLRVQLCNELLFLVYTECESVADELILAASSIPGDKLPDMLTGLFPFKLRNRVTDEVDLTSIPQDCSMGKWLLLLNRVAFEAAHLT